MHPGGGGRVERLVAMAGEVDAHVMSEVVVLEGVEGQLHVAGRWAHDVGGQEGVDGGQIGRLPTRLW